MKKKPKFFCDNCGAEVDRDLKACPQCGRFFAAVRCPKCGFSGEEKMFSSGCPSCGYSAPPSGKAHKTGRGGQREKKAKEPLVMAGPLPLWVYIFSALALLIAIVSLLFILR